METFKTWWQFASKTQYNNSIQRHRAVQEYLQDRKCNLASTQLETAAFQNHS